MSLLTRFFRSQPSRCFRLFSSPKPAPPPPPSTPPPPPPPLLARPHADIIPTALPALDFTSQPIRFRHPGYPDVDYNLGRSNILFELPRLDNGGVHHGTAFSMWYVFSGNRDGYISTDPEGQEDQVDFDDILTGNDYYFHVRDKPEENTVKTPYPVCPSFEDWPFPHNRIPKPWLYAFTKLEGLVSGGARMNIGVAERDGGVCRITGYADMCQNAHLVPAAQYRWLIRNRMAKYGLIPQPQRIIGVAVRPGGTDDVRNGIWMRQDLHAAFDGSYLEAPKFTFAVKNGKPVCHFLLPTSHLGQLYHNCEIRLTKDSVAAFFFGRFAWSIFPLLFNFLQRPSIRLIENAHRTAMIDEGGVSNADSESTFAYAPDEEREDEDAASGEEKTLVDADEADFMEQQDKALAQESPQERPALTAREKKRLRKEAMKAEQVDRAREKAERKQRRKEAAAEKRKEEEEKREEEAERRKEAAEQEQVEKAEKEVEKEVQQS